MKGGEREEGECPREAPDATRAERMLEDRCENASEEDENVDEVLEGGLVDAFCFSVRRGRKEGIIREQRRKK